MKEGHTHARTHARTHTHTPCRRPIATGPRRPGPAGSSPSRPELSARPGPAPPVTRPWPRQGPRAPAPAPRRSPRPMAPPSITPTLWPARTPVPESRSAGPSHSATCYARTPAALPCLAVMARSRRSLAGRVRAPAMCAASPAGEPRRKIACQSSSPAGPITGPWPQRSYAAGSICPGGVPFGAWARYGPPGPRAAGRPWPARASWRAPNWRGGGGGASHSLSWGMGAPRL